MKKTPWPVEIRCLHNLKGLALGAALLLAATSAHAQGLVFSDGFEGGLTQWSQDGSHNLCSIVSTSVDGQPSPFGSQMLECNWNGLVAWNDPAVYSSVKLDSWPYSREFLIRVWLRYASDVDRAFGNKAFRLYSNGGAANSLYWNADMNSPSTQMFISWESLGEGTWGDGTPLGDGGWHQVEIYVRHNTPGSSDGIVRIWKDDDVKHEAVGIVSSAADTRWYPLYLMSNWSNNPGWEHDANNHVQWDGIEIYSDLGSGASGSMADGSIQGGSGGSAPPPPPPALPPPPPNVRILP